ncbi:MAG: glycosyltransferase family 2 protein [Chloroflexota bacterium]|nr:glycosyltransferase family 2 protein [Chloroflexota bacterium]
MIDFGGTAPRVSVIVIAWNEAEALRWLLPEIPTAGVDEVIVVDGASTDGTSDVARQLGARVVEQSGRGYGNACLSGAIAATGEILVYLDGDYADDPAELPRVLEPLLAGRAELVVGTRDGPGTEVGALPRHQRLGNRLVAILLRALYGVRLSDPGSYRAIRRDALLALDLRQMTHGWPVEMIVSASKAGLRIEGVPDRYRRRIGISKVGGTPSGSLKAGYRMLAVIVSNARSQRRHGTSTTGQH